MPRVKRGTKRHNRRKKLLSLAKGYYLNKSKLYKFAKESVEKALVYAYRDRKVRKRDFRRLWIVRIGAAARHEWTELQSVHFRTEEGRRRYGSQDPCGYRCCRILPPSRAWPKQPKGAAK